MKWFQDLPIARKLAVHFVDDDPPASLVERLARTFRDREGNLPALYRVLAEAPELQILDIRAVGDDWQITALPKAR